MYDKSNKNKKSSLDINTIFFDVGGVLLFDFIDEKITDLAKKYDKDPSILLEARKKYRPFADKGQISDNEFWDEIFKTAGIKATEADRNVDIYMEELEGVRDIAETLKGKKYQIAILSNDSREMFRRRRQHFDLDQLFSDIILSSEHGFIKPEPDIYWIALKKMTTLPENALLIDDRPENIEKAQEIGMHGILFLNAAQLRDELYRLGIDLF